ncbi:hypothetical protein [Cyclobacterium xiamenense]|jgi:hypothetical protein|uniref:hypothetical protein n=1 Tax=Cyclobacterium xiamenense TaxID=1297121 RepID=UPI0035CE9360
MSNPSTLTLQLTLDEVNTILNALGGLPYAQVYGLVQKVQAQAEAQLAQQNGQTPSLPQNQKKPAVDEDPRKSG